MRAQLAHWIVFITVILLVSLACQVITPGDGEDAPGRILFQDDFSNPTTGWNRVSATSGETDYADGVYRIYVNDANLDIWAKPGLNFSDVSIEVDAIKVGGDRDNRFGVICRATNPTSFYTFIISSDGYYGIGKITGGEYKLIGIDALQYTDAIQPGSAFNHMRADCIGDNLTLYVNGQRLAQVQDAEFSSGDVGLIAGTYDSSGTDIRFDNFVVHKP